LKEIITPGPTDYRAASLLVEDEELTVGGLSGKMGFCNADYFIQIFKRYFGITSGRYRELKNGYFKSKT
jgi:YesN/AraC family two-component response regulator